MSRVEGKTLKSEELKYISRDGKKWVVKYRNRKTGFSHDSRHLLLSEAQEARDNAIRGQSIIPISDGSGQPSTNV